MVDRVGQKLGNYKIVQFIGRGGFADVFLAEHMYLKTQVAVKLLQTQLSVQDDMNSFLQEAQVIARLSHPHIVRVIDFGMDGEVPFLVTDYAPNGTLRQHHAKGEQLSLPLIVSYVKQLAEALNYAHDEKVIHRDIKPENMLFNKRHEVLLSDFGVALIAQSSRYQSMQEVAGTVGYMAPEQIQGRARAASDQYSLGIVVYEWLSGDRPFRGSFTEVCAQHLFAPLPPLREKVPDISPQVEQVVSLALSKEPKQRFASVQAFARALEQASQMAGPVVLSARPEPPTASVTPQTTPPAQTTEEISRPTFATIPAESSPPPPLEKTVLDTPAPPLPTKRDTPASPSLPKKEEPVAQKLSQQSSAPAPATPQRGPWDIGPPQILAMLAGGALYSAVNFLLDLLFVAASNDGYSSPQFQTYWLFDGFVGFSLMNVLVGLSLVILAFLAARYGPWVSLVSAIIGLWIGNALSDTLSSDFNPWYVYITFALFCFITGLEYIRTRGSYKATGGFLPLCIISLAAIVVALAWQSIIGSILNPPIPFRNFYLPMILTYALLGLPLLVWLLTTYEHLVAQGNRS